VDEPRHTGINELACRIVFPRGRRNAGVSALNADWHGRIARYEAARRSIIAAGHAAAVADADEEKLKARLFPHFLEGPLVEESVAVAPLVDPDAIVEEGVQMEHCVGSYVDSASRGYSLLVSMRSDFGRSTAEVNLDHDEDGRPRFVVRQNLSEKNQPAPPEHIEVLRVMLRRLDGDGTAVGRLAERIAAARQAHAVLAQSGLDGLPDAHMDALRRHIFSSLRRYLPRRQRTMEMEDWAAAARSGLLQWG
jgi:hypothetical protein